MTTARRSARRIVWSLANREHVCFSLDERHRRRQGLRDEHHAAAIERIGNDTADHRKDDDRRDALSAARALGVHYPSVLDSRGTLRRSLGFTGPPITLVVDREGRIAARIVGPVPALPALAAVIRREVGVAL